MRFFKFALLFSMIIGMSQGAFAAVADWAEEMNAPPVNWDDYGNQSQITDLGGSWRVSGHKSFGYQLPNPAVGEANYTYEFRARLAVPLELAAGDNPGRWWPIGVYMSDKSNSMNRSAAYWGVEDHLPNFTVLDKPYGKAPGPNLSNGEYAVFRVINDASGTNTAKLYIDGVLYNTQAAGGPGLNGPDDPLTFGSFEVGINSQTEWDYIRVVRGLVPIGEAIVPEPAGAGMLALAGLALLRRRS